VPGKTTATIDRERRDALYELVLDHLSGIGDFWIAIEEKDFARAERLGIEFGEDSVCSKTSAGSRSTAQRRLP
jgi:hypothetical protein